MTKSVVSTNKPLLHTVRTIPRAICFAIRNLSAKLLRSWKAIISPRSAKYAALDPLTHLEVRNKFASAPRGTYSIIKKNS